MVKRVLSKLAVNKEPYLVWNAFIDILAIEDADNLSDKQRIAQDAFWYDSELQNGGHLQYFENRAGQDYSVVIESLKQLGAKGQAKILTKAVKQLNSKKRSPIKDVESYVEEALEGEYDELDSDYYDLEPTMNDYLEKYLEHNLTEFIDFKE